ncbi:hypothetical protein BLOT_016042 [Blomia tropicalis]|nr:hypothetical protein BLOT_016042 [Blomia tropicalis]
MYPPNLHISGIYGVISDDDGNLIKNQLDTSITSSKRIISSSQFALSEQAKDKSPANEQIQNYSSHQ